MYEGHTDKAKGGGFEGGSQGLVGQEAWWVKMETNVLEQQ